MAPTKDDNRKGSSSERPPTHPDLEWRAVVHGKRPGDQFVRIARHRSFRRIRPGFIVPRPGAGEPRTGVGRLWLSIKRVLVGTPLASAQEHEERTGKIKGLAIFASDNISSSAYATEEIMRVLLLAGAGALALTMPITLVIVVVLAIVVISYQQVIRAYPGGGGSYMVASHNLGPLPGLAAG